MTLNTPIGEEFIKKLKVGDTVEITGFIYTGRDAALPKVVALIKTNGLKNCGIELEGSVIFHTAVSPAGVGPTSSNKFEIENSIPELSQAGVRLHLGKGSLSSKTVALLNEYNSVYAVTPPVTALLNSKIKSKKIVAFSEEGMEALHIIEVEKFPAIIAAAHGKSIFDKLAKDKD